MNAARLVLRSLAFHARAHAATLAGVAVASAVLTGALALGDSVRASLARAARNRVGAITAVLGNGERFFRADLGARLAARVPGLVAPAAIQLPAVAALPDGSRRAGDAQLLGVREDFFALAPPDPTPSTGTGPFTFRLLDRTRIVPGEAWIGTELARALDAKPGTELVLRVPRPTGMTKDLALVSVEDAILPLRVTVARVLADEDLGAFALEAGATPRANLFVEREWLAERLGAPARANRVFLGSEMPLAELEQALASAWEPDDVGLTWREAPADSRELVSDQVFLAEPLVAVLRPLEPPALGLMTYFVNGLAHGGRTTPYSTVCALGGLDARPAPDLVGWREALGELGADDITLNDWTATDLGAGVGDEVELVYFVLGSGRALAEQRHAFRVRAIVPTAGIGADPTLAPEFPGIEEHENCRDWEPGLPLDLSAIRDEDERYWDEHRGAPKGFVALETAQALWANRYGSFTAVRVARGQEADALSRLRTVPPGALGLPLRAVSAASAATSDFGGLFLGLSCFLIVSALLLTALFFGFGLERRAAELGVYRVSGFRGGEIARLLLAEALPVCALGAALGAALGLGYTRLLLGALESAWRGAVGRVELVFAVEPATPRVAAMVALLLGFGTVVLVVRRALRARPLALLWGELGIDGAPRGRARARAVALLACALGAPALLVAALRAAPESAGGLGFGAGLCALLAVLLGLRTILARAARPRSLAALGWTNAARRPARSLTTAAVVASSVFLLVVAGANRQGPAAPDAPRASGTGGFAFLGRTSLPVLADLRTPEARASYGLDAADLAGVELVPLRARAGDEASCLNLDAPRSPRVLGVPAGALAGRFRFAQVLGDATDPWTLLEADLGPDVVPAIVDATSLQWTLKKALGDELELADGLGRPFRARVVATLADSILQGDVLLSAQRFEERFPDEVGTRAFLVDCPPARREDVAARLARALADEGLVLVPAHERLDLLHGVQNTYLAIFQALGGLGLALGSAGLLALVLRHALERRAELALLRVVGFSPAELCALFLAEQGGLVWAGLCAGALGGAFAALPRLTADSLDAARTLAVLLLGVGLLGCAWVALGAALALRGSTLDALERE